MSRHQHQQQLGSFREPLLAIQPVELPVLPYTRVLVRGKRSQCLSDLLRPGLLQAGRSAGSQEACGGTAPAWNEAPEQLRGGNGHLGLEERLK